MQRWHQHYIKTTLWYRFNTLRPRQNRRHFADDIFKCILLNETLLVSIEISLKFIPKGPINNIPALVQIMAWCLPGDKPLSEPMMIIPLTHICVTRPQWVNAMMYATISFWYFHSWQSIQILQVDGEWACYCHAPYYQRDSSLSCI